MISVRCFMMKTACTQNKMNEKFDHLMNGNLGS